MGKDPYLKKYMYIVFLCEFRECVDLCTQSRVAPDIGLACGTGMEAILLCFLTGDRCLSCRAKSLAAATTAKAHRPRGLDNQDLPGYSEGWKSAIRVWPGVAPSGYERRLCPSLLPVAGE